MKHTIGDKVVPMSKSVGFMKPLDQCEYWKRAKNSGQNYLYVVDISKNDCVLHNDKPKYDQTKSYDENVENGYRSIGNYYCENDVVAYVE